MCKALLKLAWIGRFFAVQQPHEKENWKVIPEYFFSGLNNYHKRSPNSESIPVVVKEILPSFSELKSLCHTHIGQELVLFNNKEILIEGKTFFNMHSRSLKQ